VRTVDIKEKLVNLAESQMPAAPAIRPATLRRAKRRRAAVAAATSFAVVVAGLGVWAGVDSFSRSRPVPPAAQQGRFETFPLAGREASDLAASGSVAWAAAGETVFRLGDTPATFEIEEPVVDVAADPRGAWVASMRDDDRCDGSLDVLIDCATATRISATGGLERSIPVPRAGGGLAIGNGVVWIGGRTEVVRLNPPDDPFIAPLRDVTRVVDVVTMPGMVFVLAEASGNRADRVLIALEDHRGSEIRRVPLPGALGIAQGLGSLWAWGSRDEVGVLQIEPSSLSTLRIIPLATAREPGAPIVVSSLAFSGTTVYAAALFADEGHVYTVDVTSGDVTGTIAAVAAPVAAAAGTESVWLLHAEPARAARMTIPDPWAAHAPVVSGEMQNVPQRPGLSTPRISWVDRFERAGDELTITFLGGMYPCGMLDHVELWRDGDTVKVLVVVGTRPAPDGNFACKSVGRSRTTVVQLPADWRSLAVDDASRR